MNQISALPNPLEILFQEYNQGRIESVGFRSFTLHAGESNSYRTLKSALIVPVSGRAIFSFEHEPFIAKRGLFLHGCPDKTLTISALGEQDFHLLIFSASSAAFSETPGLWAAMGTTTTWMGATAGGRSRPASSPWVIMMAPTRRVETPQLVWNG